MNAPCVCKLTGTAGFALGILREYQELQSRLALLKLKKPTPKRGKLCYWRVDECDFNQKNKLVKSRPYSWLTVKSKDEAFKLLNYCAEIHRQQLAKQQRPKQPDEQMMAVEQAQWKVLAGLFPVTVKLKQKIFGIQRMAARSGAVADATRIADMEQQAVTAYEIESKKLLDEVPSLPVDWKRNGDLIIEAIQARIRGQDAIDYELAANWIHKSYNDLLGHEYADAVAQAIGRTFKTAAERNRFTALVIQRRKRLGLKTLRRTGPRERSPA